MKTQKHFCLAFDENSEVYKHLLWSMLPSYFGSDVFAATDPKLRSDQARFLFDLRNLFFDDYDTIKLKFPSFIESHNDFDFYVNTLTECFCQYTRMESFDDGVACGVDRKYDECYAAMELIDLFR